MHIARMQEMSRVSVKGHKNLRLVGFKKPGETNLLEGTVLLRMEADDYEEIALVEEEIITETEFLEREELKAAQAVIDSKGKK